MSIATTDVPLALNLSSDAYHASERLSNSRLKVFRESPALYHARFIAKTVPEHAPSASMRFGTLVHRGVLEGGFGGTIKRIPADVLSKGAKRGNAWEQFAAENADVELLKDEEADAVERCIKAVNGHDLAWGLLTRASTEVTINWTHEYTGLECKSRLDVLRNSCIVDLKTVRDHSPAGFARACRNLSYDSQHAFYCEAVRTALGKTLPFVFVAVNTEQPHTVRVYELDAHDVLAAHDANERAMRDLCDRLETNYWFEPGGDKITTLTLPKNWDAPWETA